MNEKGIKSDSYSRTRVQVIIGILVCAITVSTVFIMIFASVAAAGDALEKCSIPGPSQTGSRQGRTSDTPTCGIELTCTDRPVQLGYSDGVCFRATCPGIWALIHRRVDQASFRRRFVTYSHYSFAGNWELKDRGVIESGQVPLRELFLVLPDDLIEFKLRDPDCNSAIEVKNLGYVKMGSVDELKRWLAYNVYLEQPNRGDSAGNEEGASPHPDRLGQLTGSAVSGILSLGRSLGLPFCR